MKRMALWIRDWMRGFTDADMAYAKALFKEPAAYPGEVRCMSSGQYRAYRAYLRSYY